MFKEEGPEIAITECPLQSRRLTGDTPEGTYKIGYSPNGTQLSSFSPETVSLEVTSFGAKRAGQLRTTQVIVVNKPATLGTMDTIPLAEITVKKENNGKYSVSGKAM